MGDPRKHRRKYVTPSHPWERSRIEEEREIRKKFGLKTKKEIWKMQSILRSFKVQAKDLIKRTDEEAKKQQTLLIKKLIRMGLFDKVTEVEKILDLSSENLLNRRLQSVVYNKKLAHTMNQARQFIVHGHITVNGQLINIPSYLVKKEEEGKIAFKGASPFTDEDHPERVKEEKEEKKGTEVKVIAKVTGKVEKEEIKKGESAPEKPKEPEPPKEKPKTEEKKEPEPTSQPVKDEPKKEETQTEAAKKKTDEEVAQAIVQKLTDGKPVV